MGLRGKVWENKLLVAPDKASAGVSNEHPATRGVLSSLVPSVGNLILPNSPELLVHQDPNISK